MPQFRVIIKQIYTEIMNIRISKHFKKKHRDLMQDLFLHNEQDPVHSKEFTFTIKLFSYT